MSLDYVDQILRSSRMIVELSTSTNALRNVPACPDWTLSDLCLHLAEVQRRQLLRLGATSNPDPSLLTPLGDDRSPSEHLREATNALVAALRELDPASQAWNWTGANQTVAWAQRRQAHEATVHCFDALAAVAEGNDALSALSQLDISTAMARDGVREIVEVLLPSWWPDLTSPIANDVTIVHIVSTDAPEVTWELQISSDAFHASATPTSAPHLRIAAPSTYLYLWCWNRLEPSVKLFEITGDLSINAKYRALVH